MSGQLWGVAAEGGYLYSDELSDDLRTSLQHLTIFRNVCDAADGSNKGLHSGDTFRWNVYSDIARQGRRLVETEQMPESNFTIHQKSLTITEAGNSVPYTGKLQALGKHDLVGIIDKTLKNDARKYFDIEAFLQFDDCLLRAAPAGGTSTDTLTVTENGSTATTNNVAFGADHAKAVSDEMQERSIPPFIGDDYAAISHPTTLRPLKNDLETIQQYTREGMDRIMDGEIGRYDSLRFLRQNQIPKGGAIDSTTFDPFTRTADAWNNAKSSWIFFFGADTVTEAIVIPEEIRAKIPTDYGRSKGIAWYYLGGFGLVHDQAAQSRIMKWDSAA